MTRPANCPFCGHEAHAGRIGFTKWFGVSCGNDDCPVEAQASALTLEQAIADWNRRAPVAMREAA